VIQQLREGDDVAVTEGSTLTDDYNWWHLRAIDGIEGWAVEAAGWYAPFESASTSTPNP